MGKQNKSEEEGDQTLRLISDLICKVYRSKSFQVPKCTGDYQSSKMYRSKLFQNALRKKKYVGCKIYQEKKSTWVASVVARFIKKNKSTWVARMYRPRGYGERNCARRNHFQTPAPM